MASKLLPSSSGGVPPLVSKTSSRGAGSKSSLSSSSSSSMMSGSGGSGGVLSDGGEDAGYIRELLGFSLERLHEEPALLRADGERLRRQLREVGVSHHASFLSAAETLNEVHEGIANAASTLGAFEHTLESLSENVAQFREEAAAIAASRERNKLVLRQHATLVELLELPNLMDTCVRNGNFDEALDLEAFANKLSLAAGDLPVVAMIRDQAKAVIRVFLEQLLARLRSSIQLPECLRVIGYLRRLGAFSEREMRLQFLVCREEWLVGVLQELEAPSTGDAPGSVAPAATMKRVSDIHRVNLFDIVMQYRAIFADDADDADVGAANGGAGGGGAVGAGAGGGFEDSGLLFSWAQHRIEVLLETVSTTLPLIDEGSTLASVLEHFIYCGQSLGRVGLDFRPMLVPLFEVRVTNLFREGLEVAISGFVMSLSSHKWMRLHTGSTTSSAAAGGAGSALPVEQQQQQQQQSVGAGEVSSPQELVEHPPLAVLLNGFLASLNELRHCVPLLSESLGALAPLMQDAMLRSSSRLVHYHAMNAMNFEQKQLNVLLECCGAHVNVLLPHVESCFARVCPNGILSVSAASAPLTDLLAALAKDKMNAAAKPTEE